MIARFALHPAIGNNASRRLWRSWADMRWGSVAVRRCYRFVVAAGNP
jgi:hypothetical protein